MINRTILVTTYAVNPYKGSEDGMGWNFILQIARYQKVIAITRVNNGPHIAKYMEEYPSELYQNIQFLYYDLPYWMRFWKKGGRGAMLYYWMWQRGMVSFIKKQTIHFDLVHNVNFHNDWTPSFLWKLRKPFIWGPIGHHPEIPKIYNQQHGWKDKLKDLATWAIKNYFWKISSALKKTVSNADHIFCMNSSVVDVLPQIKGKYSIMPSVATENISFRTTNKKEGFHIISAGRFVPLKGFDLTIRSFATFYHSLEKTTNKSTITLTLVGSGPEKEAYKKLCSELNITENVKFIKWIERNELLKLYQESHAFLFPSHEGAGMVVAEALSFGLPVICLDNSGPGEFITNKCGFAIQEKNVEDTIHSLSNALLELYDSQELQNTMSLEARKRFETHFDWNIRGEQIKEIYDKILLK
jgi:glycosyltransferase involved in cell wall biosynthesis